MWSSHNRMAVRAEDKIGLKSTSIAGTSTEHQVWNYNVKWVSVLYLLRGSTPYGSIKAKYQICNTDTDCFKRFLFEKALSIIHICSPSASFGNIAALRHSWRNNLTSGSSYYFVSRYLHQQTQRSWSCRWSTLMTSPPCWLKMLSSRQSHLKVHLVAALVLSVTSLHQQIVFFFYFHTEFFFLSAPPQTSSPTCRPADRR